MELFDDDLDLDPIFKEAAVIEVDVPRYRYKAFGGNFGECRLRVQKKDGNGLVIWTELVDNPGMSVTNASERLAGQVLKEFELDPHKTLFVEHNPAVRGMAPESYDVVMYDWAVLVGHGWKASNATWEHVPEAKAKELLARFEWRKPDGT